MLNITESPLKALHWLAGPQNATLFILDHPDEMLALVWGPRFDREHAMWLWSRLSRRAPQQAMPVLPALMNAAEHFDALDGSDQRRVRRLILRHRALTGAVAV